MTIVKIAFSMAFLCMVFQCERCKIELLEFTKNDGPFIYIKGYKGHCTYVYEGQFWIQGRHLISGGKISFEDDALFITIDALESMPIRYFDFEKKPGDEYWISIESKKLPIYTKFVAKVDSIVKSSNGNWVHVFRIVRGFSNDGHESDLVFLVSKENGIIGSYISDIENQIKIMAVPRGDILRDVIDYSEIELRSIK